MLNINVLDKLDPDHWIFLYFVLWPCWILFNFIFYLLNFRQEVIIMGSAKHFRNPNTNVCTITEQNRSVLSLQLQHDMRQWQTMGRKESTGEQYDNFRQPQRYQLPNCCWQFTWSVPKEVQKEYRDVIITISPHLPDSGFGTMHTNNVDLFRHW